MQLSMRSLLDGLQDLSKVYEGRRRYFKLFKCLREIERLYRHDGTHTEAAQKLALLCEENGAMWIKVAQYLSCRPDLLPGEYVSAFSSLQALESSEFTAPFTEVLQVLNQCWPANWQQGFSRFNLIPVASGSIAQVYSATLDPQWFAGHQSENGCRRNEVSVAVKVRTPGVIALYEQDIIVLRSVAKCLAPVFPQIDVTSIVNEVIETTLAELDFKIEARNILDYQSDERRIEIQSPQVIQALSNDQVLVTGWINGRSLQHLLRETQPQPQLEQPVRKLALAMLEDIFVRGLYHGDPHPGNIILDEEPVLLDFGVLGRIELGQRIQYLRTVMALVRPSTDYNYGEIFRAAGFAVENESIFQAIGDYVMSMSRSDQDAKDRLEAVLGMMRKNTVRLPPGFVGIIRVILLLSGVLRFVELDFESLLVDAQNTLLNPKTLTASHEIKSETVQH